MNTNLVRRLSVLIFLAAALCGICVLLIVGCGDNATTASAPPDVRSIPEQIDPGPPDIVYTPAGQAVETTRRIRLDSNADLTDFGCDGQSYHYSGHLVSPYPGINGIYVDVHFPVAGNFNNHTLIRLLSHVDPGCEWGNITWSYTAEQIADN